ncbi:hypothetical protein [Hymenobacter coccineus]|uniref:Uncharacterized protein n=1 Tax=Hymenobacter coccineus TaxID=1908235 RepID=A0A1G1SVU7_9BACT|nr:hypothetical protein [Hymenobacter coccineus]OGX82743.1 hypothetical protein BEN49_02415 [Hymenobacter coccineus]
MNKFYCSFALVGGAALLGAPAAQAQLAGAITGLIIGGVSKSQNQFRGPGMVYRKGDFQQANGVWQRGRFYYDWQNLYIADPQNKDKKAPPQRCAIDSLRGFAFGTDTFCIVRRFTVPKTGEYVRSSFARKMYRAGGIQVNEYVDYRTGLRDAKPYTLLCRPDTTVVVPTNPQDVRRVTAYMVQDYPALSAQVLQMKEFTPEDLPRVLGAYDRWKAFNARPK